MALKGLMKARLPESSKRGGEGGGIELREMHVEGEVGLGVGFRWPCYDQVM